MWDIAEARQAARNLAALLNAAETDEQARQLVADYNAILRTLPSITRAAFVNEFAMLASPKALARFFHVTAAEQDERAER
ncbi:MAG: hypothetical protein IRY86_09860 [Thermorudis peleae]|nr:hypothetical protein [Thermorudis peleae]